MRKAKMPNGLSVKNQEDWLQLYNDDPPLAMSILFQNVSDIKVNCATRILGCEAARAGAKEEAGALLKKARMTNATIQGSGGIIGGAIAAWAYLKLFFDK